MAFAAAGAALVALAFAAALTVAWAQEALVARVEAGAPTVKRWTGVALAVLGAWLVALGVFADFFARVLPR